MAFVPGQCRSIHIHSLWKTWLCPKRSFEGNMASLLSSVQLGIESQSFLPPMDLATRPQAGQNIKEGHFMTAHRPFQNNIPNDSYCWWNAYCMRLALCWALPIQGGNIEGWLSGRAVKMWAPGPDCVGLNLAPPPLAVWHCLSYLTSLPQFSHVENGFNQGASLIRWLWRLHVLIYVKFLMPGTW